MLRSALFVFILGWTTWFWLDKPRAGDSILPPEAGSTLDNLQHALDILKAGSPELAFIYIWNAHYIILSLLGGAILTVVISSITDAWSRRRQRKLIAPEKRSSGSGQQDPEQPGKTRGTSD